MKQQEFDKTSFGRGDKAFYKNEVWLIKEVDFEEKLFGLVKNKSDNPTYCRCENAEFIPYNQLNPTNEPQ